MLAGRRRAILVLGMHRSGTSAVARVLGLCGAALPGELLPPNEYNETGYWEPEAVVRLHDEFLGALGSGFEDLRALPADWPRSPLVSAFADRLEEVLEDAYGPAPLWVVKDPRLCRLVPLWRMVLDRRGVEPLAVIPVRNPLEVAASLGERDRFSEPKSLLLWLRHVLEAEAATRDIPRSFVLYESLLRDWRAVVGRIGRDLAVEWPRSGESAAAEIETFLDEARRHHASSDQALSARPDVSPWVSTVYIWAATAARGESVSVAALDEVRGALAAADGAFSPLLAEWRQERIELAETLSGATKLEADLHDLEGKLARATGESAALRRKLTAREARIETLETERAQHRSELESVQAQQESDIEAERERRRSELSAAGERHRSELHAAGERHRSNLDSMEAQHRRELESSRTRAREDLEEARRHGIDARRELHSIQASWTWRLAQPFRWLERQGRLGSPLRRWRHLRLLRRSGLFDERWYLEQNPDVGEAGLDALTHYFCFGATEGRDPNPLFSTAWYVQRNPDVAASRLNPLLHYSLYGAAEGRDPSPAFDTAWYRAENEDVARAGLNPLAHYLRHGQEENRSPRPAEGVSTPVR